MIPIVMNASELKLIVYGKKIEGKAYKGLIDIEEEVREELGAKALPYKIGTMIELPAAALSAGEIARYSEFFSFGTNDLTQTTLGISRDDFNSFMPDYSLYDLIQGNPFSLLTAPVKDLVAMATKRGHLTRPGLVTRPLRRARSQPRQHPLLHGGGPRLRLLLALPGAPVHHGGGPGRDREAQGREAGLRAIANARQAALKRGGLFY